MAFASWSVLPVAVLITTPGASWRPASEMVAVVAVGVGSERIGDRQRASRS